MQEVAGDLFATKGIEYLLVIGYLAMLVVCWRFVRPRQRAADRDAPPDDLGFEVPDGYHFHPGHTWLLQNGGPVMRVGMDAFASRLLGTPARLELPEPGVRLTAGEPGWHVAVDGHRIPVVAPVDGEVVARNEAVIRDPGILNRDPYGEGWVVEVRVPSPEPAARNLLAGRIARAWRDGVVEEILDLAGSRGWAAQTNGHGLARAIDPDGWDRLARALLLNQGGGGTGNGQVPEETDTEAAGALG